MSSILQHIVAYDTTPTFYYSGEQYLYINLIEWKGLKD